MVYQMNFNYINVCSCFKVFEIIDVELGLKK